MKDTKDTKDAKDGVDMWLEAEMRRIHEKEGAYLLKKRQALEESIRQLEDEGRAEWNTLKKVWVCIQLDLGRWSVYTYVMTAIIALATFGLGFVLGGLTK